MKKNSPEGFFVPIHRSLTQRILMGGIPRNVAIGNAVIVVAFVMGAHNLWVLPVGVLTHVVLVALHKTDKDILPILKRNLRVPPFLRG